MLFLLEGDKHIRTTKPRGRKDDYAQSMQEKEEWVYALADELMCKAILQPGDFFDTVNTPFRVINRIINTHNGIVCPVPEYVVYGQHDLQYHSLKSIDNTPLATLSSAGAIKLLTAKPVSFDDEVHVYGCSWGESIPKIIDKSKLNILVIHKMIIKSDQHKIWEGQEDYITAGDILRQNRFQLIVSGDNHAFFTAKYKNRRLVNCGSLMRSTTAQITHKPRVVIYDTRTRKIEIHRIPVKPPKKVFDMATRAKEKNSSKKMDAFTDRLSNVERNMGYDFHKNVKRYMKENNIESEVTNIVEEVFDGIANE